MTTQFNNLRQRSSCFQCCLVICVLFAASIASAAASDADTLLAGLTTTRNLKLTTGVDSPSKQFRVVLSVISVHGVVVWSAEIVRNGAECLIFVRASDGLPFCVM